MFAWQLDLSSNDFAQIDALEMLKDLPSLQKLDLSSNKLRGAPFQSLGPAVRLSRLLHLSIPYNKISCLSGVQHFAPALVLLDARQNRLDNIGPEQNVFEDVRPLQQLQDLFLELPSFQSKLRSYRDLAFGIVSHPPLSLCCPNPIL